MVKLNSVLVIGAGAGGIEASLDLAGAGFKVYLCDRSPAIGGALIRMDRWFPDNHCGLCQMPPAFSADDSSQFCLRRGLSHPDIELMPLTEVKEVKGQAGDFRIGVISRATGVNPELCIGCGLCAGVCPVETASEFNEGLASRKAIYPPHPGILPYIYTIDWDSCTKCGACVAKCPTQAIRLKETETIRQIKVGAVILATGFEEFDPVLATQYGYQRYPNVITGIELERMLSPGGPTGGELLRPSDSHAPGSIAFLQCVGSRDSRKDYCSSTCCMFALKEATLLKQASPRVDVHIFFMDIRAFGKGYYRYYEQARDELGVKFTRSRVPVIREDPPTKNLVLTAIAEDGALAKRQFELVVLSMGQTPAPRFQELCRVLGVEVNKWGFCRSGLFSPVDTTKEGIYVCGSASAPKDIADTLVEAGAAAGQASGWLVHRPTPPEEAVESDAEEEPRLGVLLCGCGEEITSVLDLEEIAEFSRQLPDVAWVARVPYLCYTDAWQRPAKELRKHKVNRLVIGACSRYFNARLGEIGLNPSAVQTVNLREHVAWVHRDNRQVATAKAKSLLAMAVELARSPEPEPISPVGVHSKALVVGGGLAGLTAALSIARHGIEVQLVEKSAGLGGNLNRIYYTLEGGDPQAFLEDIVNQVKSNRFIHVALETELVKAEGYAGNFMVSLKNKESSLHSFVVGALIIASGGEEYRPTEYLYGQNKDIIMQKELEGKLFSAELDPKSLSSVVMIQCVGSREKGRPYCSRICCSQALKNALRLKEANPEIEMTVLYRDMTSYGFQEEYYTQAREKGVTFVRYEPEGKPDVRLEGESLAVEVAEPVLGGRLILEPDLVVLSPAIIPPENAPLAQILGVDLNEDGFFREAEAKFRPVDFLTEGVYVCGLAHSPRGIGESIAQAQAAAQRAVSLLTRGQLVSGIAVSETVQRQCSQCELCITVCPYDARVKDMESGEVVVREALCRGCGACVVACPGGAAKLRGFKDRQVFSLIDAAF